MTFPFPFFSVGSTSVTVVHTADPVIVSTTDTFTFSSVALGAGTKKIVVVVNWTRGTNVTVDSVTVDGNSATNHVSNANGTGAAETCYIFSVDGISVTTGDIVVTGSSTTDACGIVVYAVYNAASSPHDTGGDGASATASDTIDVPAKGVLIGGCILRSSTDRTFTWTGPTEDVDEVIDSGNWMHTGASETYETEQSGLTVECAPSGVGLRNPVMSLVSFGPG